MWLIFLLNAWAADCSVEPLDGTVYAFSEGVNLRMGPTVSSEVVSQLSFGTPVIVRGVGEESMLEGHQDRWYRVSVPRAGDISLSGYMFGSTLAQEVFVADLDGDGLEERILAMPAADAGVMVRVQDQQGAIVSWAGGEGDRACSIALTLDEESESMLRVSQGDWRGEFVYTGTTLNPTP